MSNLFFFWLLFFTLPSSSLVLSVSIQTSEMLQNIFLYNILFHLHMVVKVVVVTCVTYEGDGEGHDGVHEHPELQLLVSVGCQPLQDLVLVKERV